MAAVLTSELESADQIAFLINACKEMGIKVLPPDVNSSDISFSVDSGCIRFGLGAIKGSARSRRRRSSRAAGTTAGSKASSISASGAEPT